MSKNPNDFKNRNIQKRIDDARKELKVEGLLTNYEIHNLARVYVKYISEICAKQIAKEFKRLYKKVIVKNK